MSPNDNKEKVNKDQSAPTPEGVKAGNGKYCFDLAAINQIEAGPAYSTTNGSLVEGERNMVGLMTMPRGTGARPHSHPNEQWAYIMQGTFLCEIDGVKFEAKPGMVVYIPPNMVHSIIVDSDQDEDGKFFVVKDKAHGIWGNPVDTSTYGGHYEEGFKPSNGESED